MALETNGLSVRRETMPQSGIPDHEWRACGGSGIRYVPAGLLSPEMV